MMKITTKSDKAWVTFTITPEEGTQSVELMGEWNEWAPEAMKQKKNGEFYVTRVFKIGDTFQFGYRVDGCQWCIDESLPACPSPFGSENALLSL